MATHPDRLALLADIAAIKADLRALYVRWCISGPTLEATSALAAMAQEEGGHRRIAKRLAGKVPPTEAATQLFGPARIDAWPDFVGWVGPVEVALAGILDRLSESDDPQIARNLVKMAAEERYHAEFYLSWFQELEKNDNSAGRQFKSARQAGEAAVALWLNLHAAVLADTGLTIGVDGTGVSHRLPPELEGNVCCVSCGSLQTRVTASFGSSLMSAQMRCLDCGGQFEAVRHRGDPSS
jgi:hypothetical protein